MIESFQLLDPKGYEPRVEKIEILIDRIRVESEGFDPNFKFGSTLSFKLLGFKY